ncbi:MAG: RNA methyltransferase [Neisseria sp.]|nr:RNA methyltransferase [Neisseria sp.]
MKPAAPGYLDHILIILCRTSHPANIGAAARAMKTMGLTRLVLVAPNLMQTPMTAAPPVFDPARPQDFQLPEESYILASGAADVLENARICATLDSALEDTVLSCALTSRRRELAAPLQTPRQLAPELLAAARDGQKAALVFGNETFGLDIGEAQCCNRLMTINGNPDYFSLNLAQAVQVACYEIYSQTDADMAHLRAVRHPATHGQIEGMVEHMRGLMDEAGFFNRRNGGRIIRRLHNLFARAGTETEDVDILRGFFNTLHKQIARNKDAGAQNGRPAGNRDV